MNSRLQSLTKCQVKQGEGWILSVRLGGYARRVSGSDKLQLGLTGSLHAFNERRTVETLYNQPQIRG